MRCAGYKMFVRAHLDGDGIGKSTHLSLFFVVGRGNFDTLLRWPFSQRVTMTILDQLSGRHNDVTEMLRPDRSSTVLQRPTGDSTAATGFPKFLPLTSLDNPQSVFVRENAMFIRIAVDCRDI